MRAAALLATGTAGFLVGGVEGAALGVVAWTAVLIAWWRLRARGPQGEPETVKFPESSTYADIDNVIERLDDLAQERNWNLAKHFGIARMACENRTMTFDELERRYDRGLSAASDKNEQDASEEPRNDAST